MIRSGSSPAPRPGFLLQGVSMMSARGRGRRTGWRQRGSVAVAGVVLFSCGSLAAADEEPAVTLHDVLPVLLRRCTVCHGLRQQEGGLALHTRSAILRGGK